MLLYFNSQRTVSPSSASKANIYVSNILYLINAQVKKDRRWSLVQKLCSEDNSRIFTIFCYLGAQVN